MSSPAIRIEDLSKKYRKVKSSSTLYHSLLNRFNKNQKIHESYFYALKKMSLTVDKGDIIGLIGNNGAGKSTLLKVLSGITTPTSGEARLYGKVSSLLEVGTGFHPELSGLDNVYLNGALLGMNRKEISEKLEEIIDFSGISDFMELPIKNLSTGMAMRLAFSVAAHLNSDILLIDEVLGVGDINFKLKCLGKIDSLMQSERTVVLTSHNMSEIKRSCNKTIYLEKGELIMYDDTDKVIENYTGHIESSAQEKNWSSEHPSQQNPFILSEYFLSDKQGDRITEVVMGQSFAIHLNYKALTIFKDCIVKLVLSTINGEPLIDLSTRLSHDRIFELSNEGSIACIIDDLPLNKARYVLSIEIKSMGAIVYSHASFAIIEVVQGNYYNSNFQPDLSTSTLVKHRWNIDS